MQLETGFELTPSLGARDGEGWNAVGLAAYTGVLRNIIKVARHRSVMLFESPRRCECQRLFDRSASASFGNSSSALDADL